MVRLVALVAVVAFSRAARVLKVDTADDDPVSQLEAAREETNPRARRSAVRKVAKIGKDLPDDAVEPLMQFLLDDDDGDVRRAAAGGLGRMGFEKIGVAGAEALGQCLQDDTHAPARRDCAFNFGRIGEYKASLPILADAMADDDAEVRRESAVSVGKVAFKSGNEHVSDQVPILAELLANDEDVSVRREAAVALGVVKNPHTAQYLSALAEAAQNDSATSVRREAVKAMIYLHGDKDAVAKAGEILQKIAADDSEEEVRTAAENIMKRMKLSDGSFAGSD